MGKFANGFSKALALILAAAMVMTGVPTSVFGADVLEPAGESSTAFDLDDISGVSDVADTVDDISTSESFDSNDTSSIDDLDATMEREEEPGRDRSTGDITIKFTKADANVQVLDPYSLNGATAFIFTAGSPDYYNLTWDSDKTLSVKVTPATGYVIDSTKDISVAWTVDNGVTSHDVTKSSSGYGFTVSADGTYATITLNKAVLELYKSQLSATPSDNEFKVSIAASTAKYDSYNLTVKNTNPIPADELKVTYNDVATLIDLNSYQPLSKPITSVKVYTGYVDADHVGTALEAGNEADVNSDSKDYYFNRAADGTVTFKLAQKAINAGYVANKNLTIIAESDEYSISQGNDSYNTALQFKLDGASTYITKTTDYSKKLVVEYKNSTENNTRMVNKISYVVTYADGTSKTVSETSTLEVPTTDLEPSVTNRARSVVVTPVTTSEAIDKSSKKDANTTITGAATCTTGTDYEFTVVAASTYKVESVGYILGNDLTVDPTPLTSTNGKYKIPGSVVKNKITIVTKAVAAGNDTVVKKGSDTETGYFTINDKELGTGLSTGGASLAKYQTPYYFTVEATAGHSIKAVKYSISGGEKQLATAETTKGLYSIPASRSEGYITIFVEDYSMKQVIIPTNTKAVVWYNGEAQTSNFYVRDDQDFTFTLKGAAGDTDGTITFNEVKYVISGSGGTTVDKTLDNVATYTATINANAIVGAITISAATKELAKAGTYTVVFTPDSNSNYGWNETTDAAITVPDTINNTLLIACTDVTTLTPTLTVNGTGVGLTSLTTSDVEFATKSGKETTVKVEQASDPENPKITSKAQGTESLKYTYKLTTGSGVDTNVVSYTGELALSVEPHYTVALAAKDTSGNATDIVKSDKAAFDLLSGTATKADYAASKKTGMRAILTATVKNKVTHASIAKSSALAPAATVTWTGGTGVFVLTKGSAARAADNSGLEPLTQEDLGAVVAANGSANAAGSFNIVIKQGDYTYTASTPVSVFAVENDVYTMVRTVKVDNGAETFEPSASTPIALNVKSLKKADIEYKLYKNAKGTSTFADAATIKSDLEAGNIEDVTSAAAFEMTYHKKLDADTVPTFITVAGSNGTYTATASAKGTYTVDVEVSATINHQKKTAGIVEFTVDASPATAKVPFITNDSTTVVTLPDTYLSGKDYSRGYNTTPVNANNGYQVIVDKGTELTLPTEVVGLDAKRMLVGWGITTSGAAIHGTTNLSNEYYMPGQKVVVDADVTSITAIYAARYTLAGAGLFRNDGTTNTVASVTTSYKLVNNVITPVTETNVVVPVSTTTLAGGGSNVKFSVYADGDANVLMGAKVVKSIVGPSSPTVDVYPEAAASKTNSKVVWKAYDGTNTSETDETALATLTVLDANALKTGYVKGLKAGSAVLYAVYYDEDGNEYASSARYAVTVEARPSYSVEFDSGFPTEIEVGQVISTATGTDGITISKSGTDISSTALTNGTLTWTVTGAGKVELTEAVSPVIKGVTVGAATVKATYTDNNGVVIASTEKTITVKQSAVSINLTDATGAATTAVPEVAANAGANTKTTLYVTVTDTSSGNYITGGTLSAAADASAVITSTGFDALTANTNIHQMKGTPAATAKNGKVTITFSKDSKDYTKEVDFKTYYTLKFDTSKTLMVSDAVGTIAASDLSDFKINGTGGVADGNDYIVKIYADDLDDSTPAKFDLDLSGFSATYSGAKAIDFAGWTVPHTSAPAATTLANVVKKLEGVTGANLLIAPQFKDKAISSINVSKNTISIDNLDAAAKLYDSIEVSAAPISAAVVNATSSVKLTDATDGFFYLEDGTVTTGTGTTSPLPLTATPAVNVYKYSFTVLSRTNLVGDAKVTISAVGSNVIKDVNVKVYGQYKDDKYDLSKDNYRYKKADGTDAKDTAVTVNTVKRFYDEDGYLITKGRTGAATAHDEDGNLVLLTYVAASAAIATAITTNGFHASADSDGNDYFIENGVVKTGLFDVSGVQRYANTKGVLVTYAMTVAQGTPGVYTDPVDKSEWRITNGTNAAEANEKKLVIGVKYTWTPEKNKDYKSSTVPTVKVEISYTLEESKTPGTETLNLTGKLETSPAGKKVYTAPITVNGYYTKDGKAEYDFTKDSGYTKTYTVDDSGNGTSGGDDGDQKAPSEPANQAATGANYNLFFNNSGSTVELEVPVPGDVDDSKLSLLNAKDLAWQKYWKYESGTVTLSATDAKSRAAAAKTSTIVLPKVDTDGALIGDFEYSLPVTYLKPTLKLSSKAGTVYTNNSADQTVTTQVLMLASSGLYEPLDLTSFDSATTLFALAKGGPATVDVSATDATTGVIEVTTKATTSGTFNIKLDNWSEAIPLKYAVKAVAKDTLTVSAPTVTLNSSIADGTGADVDVLVCLNGEPVDLTDTSITVTPSKNFASGNFDYDLRTDGVAKFSYKSDGAPVAGKYSLTFVKGKAKAAITIVVNGKPLANAVKYKINTKLNVTTGQKMVITPTLVGVAGPITDAKIDNASSKFEASYNEARNQIIVGVKSGETVPVSKANTEVITVTAGGIECPVTVKFATVSSKIAVKIAKVTLPLAKLSAGTAEGETNVLATYKIGKKTFTIDPVSYQFMDGKKEASEDSENPGWYKINASGVRVHYDQTTGKIEVVSLSGAQKAGAVVVNLTFNGGVTVKAKVPVTLKK